MHVFIGTSTGMYFTNVLNGSSTVWTQEADVEIGNTLVTMIDYRAADNTIAVATHGRGVFTAQISEPLAVELVAFTARNESRDVVLEWETATEIDNALFEIERRADAGWESIGEVAGAGSSSSLKSYTYRDHFSTGTANARLRYRLTCVDRQGAKKIVGELEAVLNEIPQSFTLGQNYPNPFNPTTAISFQLSADDRVLLTIFDALGREVAVLVNEEKPAGTYKATWNATGLPSGVYFYRLQAGAFVETKKLLLLK